MIQLIKNNLWIIIVIVLLSSIGVTSYFYKKYLTEYDAKLIVQSNYEIATSNAKTYLTKSGKLASEVNSLQLSLTDLNNSNSKALTELFNLKHDLSIKDNQIVSMQSYYIGIIDTLKARVIRDTIIQGIRYNEFDKYTDGYISINRFLKNNSDTAVYAYRFDNVKIYTAVSIYKVGNWKLINLFHKRPINTKVTLTSNYKKLIVDSLTYVTIK